MAEKTAEFKGGNSKSRNFLVPREGLSSSIVAQIIVDAGELWPSATPAEAEGLAAWANRLCAGALAR